MQKVFHCLRKSSAGIASILLAVSITACGGGATQHPSTPAPPEGPAPSVLQIAPLTTLQSVGATQQFTATVTFSDATTRDVTAQSFWSSNANSIAAITQAGGLESAVGVGDVTISASFSAAGKVVQASTLVHVTQTPLQALDVEPANGQLELGANQQFIAFGRFEDGSVRNLTELVSWSTNDKSVLRVNTTPGRIGLANTRGPGAATIHATINGQSAGTGVTVVRRVPRFLYTAGVFGVEGYAIDSTNGKLTQIAAAKFTAVGSITSLAVSRDQKFLYASDSVLGVVWGFQIGASGELTALADGPFITHRNSSPVSVVAHPTSDFLFMTDAVNDEITTFTIGANGSLAATASPVKLANTQLLFAAASSDGRFFFQGLHVGPTATIPSFSIAPDGSLAAVPGDAASTDFIPKTLTVDPSGRFLYAVISSSSLGSSTSVIGYNIDPVAGTLSLITTPFTAGEDPISAATDASGRFLYVANGAASPDGNSVSGFSIDEVSGTLTELSGSPFPAATSPVSVAVEPGAQFAYVGLAGTQGVRGFAIDPLTGALTEVHGSPFPADGSAQAMVATH